MVSSVSSPIATTNRFDAVFAEASRATGANFDFLLATAKRESGLRSDAKAPTSSATGLFQFIESTWLETMKEAGPSLGFQHVANKIRKVGENYVVPDRSERREILNMRKDPKVSALMAGAYAQKNEEQLTGALGRKPKNGELYAAHFLGAKGSAKLIGLSESRPEVAAYRAFPSQAQANKGVFYHKNGQAKSVREVYDNLVATVPNGAEFARSDSRLVQANVQPLQYVDNLGDRFRKKNSELVSFMAQLDTSPVRRSRYGGELEASDVAAAGGRRSRYSQPESITKSSVNASDEITNHGSSISPAPVNLLPDELTISRDGEIPVVPKPKPAGLAHAGQRFAELMEGAKDAVLRETRVPGAEGGVGAIDLTQFLSGTQISDKPKG